MDNNNTNNQETQNTQGYPYGQTTEQTTYGQNPYGESQQNVNATQPQNTYQSYQPYKPEVDETVSVGEWIMTMVIGLIPCVNIIMVFVWAFGSSKKSKANYFKALLIWALIWTVIALLISILAGAAVSQIVSELTNSL